jgi:hypothetical protein
MYEWIFIFAFLTSKRVQAGRISQTDVDLSATGCKFSQSFTNFGSRRRYY